MIRRQAGSFPFRGKGTLEAEQKVRMGVGSIILSNPKNTN
jgi:hypothetical protein